MFETDIITVQTIGTAPDGVFHHYVVRVEHIREARDADGEPDRRREDVNVSELCQQTAADCADLSNCRFHHLRVDLCDRVHRERKELAEHAGQGDDAGGDGWSTAGRGSLRS